jgi:proteic killer suppression protein
VIKGFTSKALSKLFLDGDTRKVQPKHIKRLKLILTALNVATRVQQMDMPGLRFHLLKGSKKVFAVCVDENFRVTFKFEDGHATEVDYVDYH